MDIEGSSSRSPVRLPLFVDCLGGSLRTTEQSIINISIKDESLDVVDSDSSEESSHNKSEENVVDRSSSKLLAEENNDSIHPVTRDQNITKLENNAEYSLEDVCGSISFDTDSNLRNSYDLGEDGKEINKPTASECRVVFNSLDTSNFESDLDNFTVADQNSPISNDSDNLEDFLLLDDNTFSCSICSFTTDKQRILKDHERHHRKKKLPIVQCIYCNQRYTRYMLYLHINNVHPGQKFQICDEAPNKSYKCFTCSFSTSGQTKFKLHMQNHLSAKLTEKLFLTQSPEEDNSQEHISKANKPTENFLDSETASKCSICSFSTNEQEELNLHIKEHLFEPTERTNACGRLIYDCRLCSYGCPSSSDITLHINSHRKNLPIKKCPKCDFKSTSCALRHHILKCRKKTRSAKKSLRKNEIDSVKSANPKIAPFKKSFKSITTSDKLKIQLSPRKHLFEPGKRTNASGNQGYYCKMCSYGSRNYADLLSHINCHKNNLPIVKCQNCDFKSTSRALKCHLRKCKTNLKLMNVEITQHLSSGAMSDPDSVKLSNPNNEPSNAQLESSTCSTSTTSQLSLEVHMKKHLFKSASRSNLIAGKTTSNKLKIHLPMKKHLFKLPKRTNSFGHQVYYCKMCSYETKKIVAIRGHINCHKSNVPIINCPNCDFRSTSRVIKFHLNKCRTISKLVSEEYVCEAISVPSSNKPFESNNESSKTQLKCPKSTSQLSLKVHRKKRLLEPIELTDPSGRKFFRCKLCSYISFIIGDIIKHFKIHKKGIPIKKCPNNCGFESTFMALKFHLRKCRTINSSGIDNISETKPLFTRSKSATKILRKHMQKCKPELPKAPLEFQESPITTLKNAIKMYRCNLCSFVTIKQQIFAAHVKYHLRKLPIIKCPRCNFKSTPKALERHICNTHRSDISGEEKSKESAKNTNDNDDSTGDSTEGGTTFSEDKQKNNRDPTADLKCKLCSLVCARQDTYKRHMRSHRLNRPIKKCKYCNFRSTPKALYRHICNKQIAVSDIFEENKTFSCNYCSFVAAKETHYKQHMQSHARIHRCYLCSFLAVKQQVFAGHMKSHLRKLPIRKCPQCNFKSTPNALKQHICNKQVRDIPEENKSKECCKNPNDNDDSNEVNTEGVAGFFKGKQKIIPDPTADLKCKLCSLVCARRYTYKRHMQSHRLNRPIKKCKFCNFRSTSKILSRHSCNRNISLPGILEEEKTKKFAENMNYNDSVNKVKTLEVATVSREKQRNGRLPAESFKCNLCSLVCTRQWNFKRHMLNHKLNQPIKKCQFCDFRSTPMAVTRHICDKKKLFEQNKMRKLAEYMEHNNGSNRVKTDTMNSEDGSKAIYIKNTLNSSIKNSMFQCSECSFSTYLRIKLNFHTKKYHQKLSGTYLLKGSEGTFKCGCCSYITSNGSNFIRHTKTHRKSKLPIEKCQNSDYRSTNRVLQIKTTQALAKNKLKICSRYHVRDSTHSCWQKLTCSFCPFISHYRQSLKNHMEIFHSSKLTSQKMFKPVYKCKVCEFNTLYISKLTRHLKNEKHESCVNLQSKSDIVPSSKSRSIQTKDDQNTVRNEDTIIKKKYNCITCSFSTSYKGSLNRHMDSHVNHTDSNLNQPTVVRPRRNSSFDKTTLINQKNTPQLVEIDQNQPKAPECEKEEIFMASPGIYACKICSYTSSSRGRIHAHNDAHRKRNLPLKQCPNCCYRSTSHALAVHMPKCPNKCAPSLQTSSKITADVPEIFKCHMCSFTTTQRSHLNRHLNIHSVNKSPIKKCKNCDFKGTYQLLEKHRPICPNKTSKKVLLNCSNCSYSTYLPKILKGHEEKNHPKKEIKSNTPKSFKCEFCSFSSFWQYLIDKHMNSHTLLKLPIEQCSKCDFRSTPAALSAHTNQCTKKSKVLSDVTSNSTSTKKLKGSESDVHDSAKIDSSRVTSDNQKTINGIKSIKTPEEARSELSQVKDKKGPFDAPETPTKSSLKAAFACPKCPFSTHLRIKLKFHLQKNHL